MEPAATRRPTRDYKRYSRTPWGFWDVLYARRSHRSFLPDKPDEELPGGLGEVVGISCRVRGVGSGRLILTEDPEITGDVKRRSYKGLPNKMNIWLSGTPAAGFLVLALPGEEMESERPVELAKLSMAAEDCLLWLTERGYGTCWLGGVNSRELTSAVGLDRDYSVPAVIVFGRPRSREDWGPYQKFTYRNLSRRRKTLERIAFVETMEKRYCVRDIDLEGLKTAPDQGVRELLLSMAESSPGSPTDPDSVWDLRIDACLEAARLAPSAGNSQPWNIVVVREERRLAAAREACGSEEKLKAALVAGGRPRRLESRLLEKPFWMIDVPIAMSHMSLMAASMLVAGEVRIEEVDERALNDLVRVSPGVRTVGVVGLGSNMCSNPADTGMVL